MPLQFSRLWLGCSLNKKEVKEHDFNIHINSFITIIYSRTLDGLDEKLIMFHKILSVNYPLCSWKLILINVRISFT